MELNERGEQSEVDYPMGTVASEFPGSLAAVFLLAENRLLREALLRILSKKDDIRVVGSGSYGPDVFDQIVATQANVVVLDSVSPVVAEHGAVRELVTPLTQDRPPADDLDAVLPLVSQGRAAAILAAADR